MKKESNPVYSARINPEILDKFKQECERLNIDHKYVVSEYMKKFIVLNSGIESYEKAIFFDNEKMEFLED